MANRTIRCLVTLALMALPASVGHAERAPVAGAAQAVTDAEFTTQFAAYTPLPAPVMAAHAVDVTAIEPAVEPEVSGSSLGQGVASYYADKFNGRRTASGETFHNRHLTAAHRTLPFGSKVRVTNPRTGATVVVRINDRGPFTRGRTIDLSRTAAEQVGIVRAGHGTVELALLES